MLSTVPAGILNWLFIDESFLEADAEITDVAYVMLAIVGPVEESMKFLAVFAIAARSKRFTEPMDALILAAAASLGFATLENALYTWQFGWEVMIGRGPLSTLAHAVFSGLWGYALALYLQSGRTRRWVIPVGIAAAALAHGGFNVAVFFYPPIAFALVVLGGIWLVSRLAWARRVSAFRLRRSVPMSNCRHCNLLVRPGSNFCRHCGQSRPVPSRATYVCGRCGDRSSDGMQYCASCGDRFSGRRPALL
jgi:RsiW-degrading membrane proteinase PrsW (M82 family)